VFYLRNLRPGVYTGPPLSHPRPRAVASRILYLSVGGPWWPHVLKPVPIQGTGRAIVAKVLLPKAFSGEDAGSRTERERETVTKFRLPRGSRGTRAKDRPPLTAALRAPGRDGGWGANPASEAIPRRYGARGPGPGASPGPVPPRRYAGGRLVGRSSTGGRRLALGVGQDRSTWRLLLAVSPCWAGRAPRAGAKGPPLVVGHAGSIPAGSSGCCYRVWPGALPVRMNLPSRVSWTPTPSAGWNPRLRPACAQEGPPLLSGPDVDARIREGESMLYDRVCEGVLELREHECPRRQRSPYPEVTRSPCSPPGPARDAGHRSSVEAMRRMLARWIAVFRAELAIACLPFTSDTTAERRRLRRGYIRTGFSPLHPNPRAGADRVGSPKACWAMSGDDAPSLSRRDRRGVRRGGCGRTPGWDRAVYRKADAAGRHPSRPGLRVR